MTDKTRVSVPLADTIRALRAELYRAMVQKKDEELRFALGEVEIELQMEVSHEAGADAGIRFGVVSIGAKGSAKPLPRNGAHVARSAGGRGICGVGLPIRLH